MHKRILSHIPAVTRDGSFEFLLRHWIKIRIKLIHVWNLNFSCWLPFVLGNKHFRSALLMQYWNSNLSILHGYNELNYYLCCKTTSRAIKPYILFIWFLYMFIVNKQTCQVLVAPRQIHTFAIQELHAACDAIWTRMSNVWIRMSLIKRDLFEQGCTGSECNYLEYNSQPLPYCPNSLQ